VRSITAQVPIRVEYEVPALGHELIVKFQPLKVGAFTAPRRALTSTQEFDLIKVHFQLAI
jgi:hypothetical protein